MLLFCASHLMIVHVIFTESTSWIMLSKSLWQSKKIMVSLVHHKRKIYEGCQFLVQLQKFLMFLSLFFYVAHSRKNNIRS